MSESGARKPLRVLMVEDCEDDALLLLRTLKKGGFETEHVLVDSIEGMERALRQNAWDLVITDHCLPGFNSREALVMAKAHLPDTPVIIVSGSIGEELAVDAMRSGAQDYIMKENLMRLVPAVERELQEAASRRLRRQTEATIRHMAVHDALTGLTNRYEFERRLREAIDSARERETVHALLYLDLDQFKIINDTSGHEAGDELLRQLGQVLKSRIRESDTLARLGGDEFGLLLEGCQLDHALQMAENLLKSLNQFHFAWQGKVFSVGGSIGLVPITAGSGSPREVLSAADMSCYVAKDEGRNRIHVYSDGDSELARRRNEMEWAGEVTQALREERFVLFSQPIMPLAPFSPGQGQVHREFLLRMRHADGSLISPGAFIPAAERYNIMPAVDRWVIDAVLSHLARNRNNVSVVEETSFINLSGSSLSDAAFFDYLREKLRQYRIPPERLCFEITETAAITHLGRATEFIKDIRAEGCRFALDDFGSGLSSFPYLKMLPVNYLKIDGAFVQNILSDPMDCAFVEAIHRVAHVAGIQTIAEFIESEPVRAQLLKIGVDYGQGYHLGSPEPLYSI